MVLLFLLVFDDWGQPEDQSPCGHKKTTRNKAITGGFGLF